KEKELTHARDALAAERRRMPWLAVEKKYEFDGPEGKASLLDLFDGRRQHACIGCSMVGDQGAHPPPLDARGPPLAFVPPASRRDIARLKARMGWSLIPWYRITDDFDKDFVARHKCVYPERRPRVPYLLHQQPWRRSDGRHLGLSRYHCARASGEVGGLAG